MAERNDDALATALKAVAQAMHYQPNIGGNDGSHVLETSQKNLSPIFKGRYDPNGT